MSSGLRGFDLDIVCFSHLRWDFVYQRCQHLMSRAGKTGRVLYIEEPVADPDAHEMKVRQVEEGVLVAVPHLPPHLVDGAAETACATMVAELVARQAFERFALWMYTPMALPLAAGLRPSIVVYDCMDELTGFAQSPPELRERESLLLRRADLVFTGGRSLYEAKREAHEQVYLFPSSVDHAHFAQAREPQDAGAEYSGMAHPRLGFAGVVDERFDVALLGKVADLRPDWQFVMLGPIVKIDEAALPRRANIHYLGARPYSELPRHMSAWDIGIIPFAQNEATRFISPTKTPEYLAAGLPVVSTPIADIVKPYGEQGLVAIAGDAESFVACVAEMLESDQGERQQRADLQLASTSWDRTWGRMRQLMLDTLDYPSSVPRITVAERGFDYLVVGAGFAGSIAAERLAREGAQRVMVVDRRAHIGGNAYDEHDEHGILVHRYGPHIFHTNAADVFEYLSRFTKWRPYEHRVLASVDGRLVPMPINLDTINSLYGLTLTSLELEAFYASAAEEIGTPKTAEDAVVSRVGRDLYLKFFRNYTRKQWGLDPSELDASVSARVPARTNRDDRYFTDTYQAMPLHGYTRMFGRMLDHPRISVVLNTDYRDLVGIVPHRELIYTGPIDEYFDCCYGALPYRSLEFRFETYDTPRHQAAAVLNYPNEHAYTRSTEFKYLTGQVHAKTTLVYEHPTATGDPYYPVPRQENTALYQRYKKLADATDNVHFIGRLATYRYYNMDQVAAQALVTVRRMLNPQRDDAARAGA
ncbi:MAG: UDP-galactopyranose mutase [Gaiellales bacterium]|nr:UDP-galactopyranose mutase [Gaiellales bacterium]